MRFYPCRIPGLHFGSEIPKGSYRLNSQAPSEPVFALYTTVKIKAFFLAPAQRRECVTVSPIQHVPSRNTCPSAWNLIVLERVSFS